MGRDLSELFSWTGSAVGLCPLANFAMIIEPHQFCLTHHHFGAHFLCDGREYLRISHFSVQKLATGFQQRKVTPGSRAVLRSSTKIRLSVSLKWQEPWSQEQCLPTTFHLWKQHARLPHPKPNNCQLYMFAEATTAAPVEETKETETSIPLTPQNLRLNLLFQPFLEPCCVLFTPPSSDCACSINASSI